MGAFQWISEGSIPPHRDLRQHGWQLAEQHEGMPDCILVAHAATGDVPEHSSPREAWLHAKRLTLVSGVNTPERRAGLLREGFGDAVSDDMTLVEFAARACRLADMSRWLPRRRSFAQLELDLLAREAVYLGRPLGLHPLEFAMLWRLSETPGHPVSRDRLITDVWRLASSPNGNSMAVQLSRLRGKLAVAGLAGLIETVGGSYVFQSAVLEPARRALWLETRHLPPFDIGSASSLLS